MFVREGEGWAHAKATGPRGCPGRAAARPPAPPCGRVLRLLGPPAPTDFRAHDRPSTRALDTSVRKRRLWRDGPRGDSGRLQREPPPAPHPPRIMIFLEECMRMTTVSTATRMLTAAETRGGRQRATHLHSNKELSTDRVTGGGGEGEKGRGEKGEGGRGVPGLAEARGVHAGSQPIVSLACTPPARPLTNADSQRLELILIQMPPGNHCISSFHGRRVHQHGPFDRHVGVADFRERNLRPRAAHAITLENCHQALHEPRTLVW